MSRPWSSALLPCEDRPDALSISWKCLPSQRRYGERLSACFPEPISLRLTVPASSALTSSSCVSGSGGDAGVNRQLSSLVE